MRLTCYSLNTILKTRCEKGRKSSSSPPTETNPNQLSIGEVLFSQEYLDQAAGDSAFVKRKSRKIDLLNLLASLVEEGLLGSPSKNDLAAAPELEIMEGDLVLRDRGYLTAGEIQRHIDRGADFIYHHKTGMIYLDPETHLAVDLPALLKRWGNLDLELLMNDTQRTRIRLKTRLLVIAAASNLYP